MDDRTAVFAGALPAVRRSKLRMDSAPRHIALIGTYPPRRCGIATFTKDLHDALMACDRIDQCDVYALNEEGSAFAYPSDVAGTIDQHDARTYIEVARRIDLSGAEVVCLQHEYGIFGGEAGALILTLLASLKTPVVTTLHTVLERPDLEQRRVLQDIVALSARVVVMAERGSDILRRVYNTPASKIVVTPHGAPDLAREPTDAYKARFGWADRRVLLTFGLLSPNKGLEHMLAAMPHIVEHHPQALYVILGATHPHLRAREGEAYRNKLITQAHDLGVTDHVLFVDEFVDDASLRNYLRATDVYITPYLNEAQITSGTLANAIALGRAIVSTPYWHASEALADGRGVLCPFGDADALADAVTQVLSDETWREQLGMRAYALGRQTTWPNVAGRYLSTFVQARTAAEPRRQPRKAGDPPMRLPALNLAGLEALTDDRGIMQHTVFGVADRTHGYCLDDAARALVLVNDAHQAGVSSASVPRLARGYAAFVQHAWNGDEGCFRNFMSFDGRWLEARGSSDSFGRAVWAIGVTAARGASPMLRQWAANLASQVLPHVKSLSPLRSRALASIGLAALAEGEHAQAARRLLRLFADDLLGHLKAAARPEWVWFEERLAYDNARLPEALLRSAHVLGDATLAQAGLDALRWLCGIHTAEQGWFRPVGSESLGGATIQRFDQQPLEAAAAIDACRIAYDLTNDPFWSTEARRAYEWYLGRNDLGMPIATPEEGICHDGLTRFGVNANQGAESVIAFQAATCAMHAFVRDRRVAHAPRAS